LDLEWSLGRCFASQKIIVRGGGFASIEAIIMRKFD